MISGMIIGKKYSKNYIAEKWAKMVAIEEVYGKKGNWNEDDLYETIGWLSKKQREKKKQMSKEKYGEEKKRIVFMYA